MVNCINCNSKANDNFCSNCGQPLQLKRVDSHYIFHEIQHILHFEKGILYTIKGLLLNPGKNIREFIKDNRSRLVKPIVFIVITSLIYTLMNNFFHIEDGYINIDNGTIFKSKVLLNWIQSHYGYANIIMGVFIAFWAKHLFKAYQYNFFEILILLCFVVGMAMLILSVFAVLEGLTKISLMKVSGILALCYCVWGIGQFFDGKKPINYLKAFFAYTLGAISFCFLIILLMVLIEFSVKH